MIIIWDQETEPNKQFKYTAILVALVYYYLGYYYNN
mgnify:CR=1 FL=1